MKKDKPILLSCHPKFRALIKVESALRGQSVFAFTKELGESEELFSKTLAETRNDGLRRKNGFGFKF